MAMIEMDVYSFECVCVYVYAGMKGTNATRTKIVCSLHVCCIFDEPSNILVTMLFLLIGFIVIHCNTSVRRVVNGMSPCGYCRYSYWHRLPFSTCFTIIAISTNVKRKKLVSKQKRNFYAY